MKDSDDKRVIAERPEIRHAYLYCCRRVPFCGFGGLNGNILRMYGVVGKRRNTELCCRVPQQSPLVNSLLPLQSRSPSRSKDLLGRQMHFSEHSFARRHGRIHAIGENAKRRIKTESAGADVANRPSSVGPNHHFAERLYQRLGKSGCAAANVRYEMLFFFFVCQLLRRADAVRPHVGTRVAVIIDPNAAGIDPFTDFFRLCNIYDFIRSSVDPFTMPTKRRRLDIAADQPV